MTQLSLNWLEIQDFGPYRGRQRLEFAPPNEKRPITLIGGLNGAGKTTLLEAVLFVLHGKNAPTQKRSRTSYPKYLRDLVNRHSETLEASVTLSFTSTEHGRTTEWKVTRFILKKKANYDDSLTVRINGKLDKAIAKRWGIEVESLWPRHLTNILFFDGERLKELASPEATSAALKASMKLMLGGLPVNRAVHDLRELEKRILKREDLSGPDREKLDKLQSEIESVQSEVTDVCRKLAALRSERDRELKKSDKLSAEFSAHGGDLVAQVSKLKAERDGLGQELKRLEESMRELAAGALPLAIIPDEIDQLCTAVEAEAEQNKNVEIGNFIADRDRKVLQWIKSEMSDLNDEAVNAIGRWLEKNKPQVDKEIEPIHSPGLLGSIGSVPRKLAEAKAKALQAVKRHEECMGRLEEIERTLQDLPGEDDVLVMKENLLRTEAKVRHLTNEIEELEKTEQRRRAYKERLNFGEQKLIKKIGKTLDQRHESVRVLETIPDLISFFEKYEKVLLRNSVEDMQERIFECFARLFKKEDFISALTIHPDSFEISLFDSDGQETNVERLSAGERQMLATAIIWALSQLSEHSTPMVIDTPMGRLDGEYRAKFVSDYLSNAASQVLVLSTDEEVSGEYYNLLKDAVGAEYELRYIKSEESTKILEGYPYKEITRTDDEVRRAAA